MLEQVWASKKENNYDTASKTFCTVVRVPGSPVTVRCPQTIGDLIDLVMTCLCHDYSHQWIWKTCFRLFTCCNLLGKAERKHCKFKPDPNIPELFTAHNEDYLGSGWSRGHMAPAGDNKFSEARQYLFL